MKITRRDGSVEYGPTRTDLEQCWRDSVTMRYSREPGQGGSYDDFAYECSSV